MDGTRRIRNLGILAHVDAGKTTLTEQMLFLSGSIKSVGNVDKGTSLSDGLDVEKKRGISVRASTLSFAWRDVQLNLIDTPGHVDFAAEVERSLRVLDCAVLVLSAVEGIQAHTETLWEALAARQIPVMLFVNKIDRIGADSGAVFAHLKSEFSPDMVLMNRAVGEGESGASVVGLTEEQKAQRLEQVAETDDALLARYFDEAPIDDEVLHATLADCVKRRALFPVFCGAAKNGVGVADLLDGIVEFFPDSATDDEQPVSGVVFRIDHDAKLGRVAGVRLYAGRLKNRDIVPNATADRDEKITQVKKRALDKFEDAGVLTAGDIGFLCGMPEVQIGDVLGDPLRVPGHYRLSEPLLSVQVKPVDDADHTRLAEALQLLSSEDPHLNFTWFHEERELHVKIMGVIQTEILTEILAQRFGIAAVFDEPTVIYKETPRTSGYGLERYTMPKPCWAIVKFLLEPGARGSGFTFRSEVRTNDILQKYQNEVEKSIPGALMQGIKGWEVTDLKITLVEGSDHVLHSRPGNFMLATHIALMKGLTATDTILLEPYLAFRISAPEEFMGKVTADVIQMRGTLEPADMGGGHFVLKGRFPLATSMDYAVRLNSLTGGKAKLALHFDGYEACPEGEGVVRPYKGICPLDRSKYILKMRGAITTSVAAL